MARVLVEASKILHNVSGPMEPALIYGFGKDESLTPPEGILTQVISSHLTLVPYLPTF